MAGSALEQVQTAVYSALSGDSTFMALIANQLYDSVPDNTDLPYATIRTTGETKFDTFGKNGKSVTFDVHAWADRGSKSASATAFGIVDQAASVLHLATLSLTNYTLCYVEHTQSQAIWEPDNVRHAWASFNAFVRES